MIRTLVDTIRTRVSGAKAVELASAYREYPLLLGFSPYHEGIKWLRDRYAQYGLDAEILAVPADGETLFGDHHYPLAWDVEEAWLRMTAADGADAVLAEYATDPCGVVPFCADSGGVRDAVIVPVGVLRERGRPEVNVEIVVLFDGYPRVGDIKWAREFGCSACIAHPGASPAEPIAYRARRWFNDLFGEGQIDRRQQTLPAFSVSSEQAAWLVGSFELSGPIPVRYLVRARTYVGTVCSATARIVGTDDPDIDVFATAHAYEPNSSNNVAGVAVCLEAARVLADLIGSGELSLPRRSIRFFHGLEMFSLYDYALRNPETVRSALCGITVDCLGTGDVCGKGEKINLYRGYDFNPSFINGLFETVLGQCLSEVGVPYDVVEGYTGNDNVLQDPMLGPPWAMINGTIPFDAGFYHTNADTPALLSPDRMAAYATLVAATVYFVANAGREEARHLAEITCAETRQRCLRIAAKALDVGPDAEVESLRARALKFSTFAQIAVPAGIAGVQATARLVLEPERAGFTAALKPLTDGVADFTRRVDSAVQNALAQMAKLDAKRLCNVAPDDMEKRAAHMIPARKIAGSLGFGTLSAAARREAAELAAPGYIDTAEFWHFFAPQLFWLNGSRSVRDAALAHWATAWQRNDSLSARASAIEKFVRVAEFLETHGYLQIARTPIPAPVTKADIVAGLRDVGIAAGDIVMVHSSLSQFGHVIGGADSVIDALLDTVSNQGLLVMPAFTDTADGEGDPPFDPDTSVVYTGRISETFRRREGVLRNWQPTHSVAAAGVRAEEFLASEDPCDTFDRQGPWGKLLDWGGKILCFGETMGSNSYMHALEAWLLNYLDVAYARVSEGGCEKLVRITNYPDGCRGRWYGLRREAEYFRRLQPLGLYRETRIGATAALCVEVRSFTAAMHGLLHEDPALFLHTSGCLRCAERRAKLADWTVPDTV